MSPESSKETVAFQAETKQLLDLVIHSLYTHKEIFLRELISNASDALDRLHFESLRNTEMDQSDRSGLRIQLEVDKEERTLEIEDNGIGMSREEVVANIGTIASSGTKGFAEALKKSKEAATTDLPELIGQFGVGFYSAFMVADKVELETRRAGEPKGTRWVSRGDGEYTIEEIERGECGTTVVLHLKDTTGEEGSRDFSEEWVLREVVKRYSDFIEYPIELEMGEGDEKKMQVLNSQKPLWTRAKSEIEDSEYTEFYKHLTHDWNEPLETIHFKVEGTAEYTSLLYLPKSRPMDLFDPSQAHSRLQLYVKRVFITEECEELLPVWLRFVRGVVDSADLPLNVSRETLQHNRRMDAMRKRLIRKVLDTLESIAKDRREEYVEFWKAFGPVLKEGLYYDDENRDDLAKIAMWSTTQGEELTTLPEYVERMPVKQKEIYVLVAPDLETAKRSPHLESIGAQEFEVLFLTDAVDEFVLERLAEFNDKKLRRIDRGELDLEDEEAKSDREEKQKEFEPMLEAVRKELSESVEDVRFSSRLTDSPACLVSSDGELTPHMRRMMQDTGQTVPDSKRVLELNASHPLVNHLQDLSSADEKHASFADACELLLGTALVTEGGSPNDPLHYAKLVTEMMMAKS